ncbi:MAG: hypothetical protein ACOCUV_03700 [bacterium]
MNIWKKIIVTSKNLSASDRKNLYILFFSYFLILFTYPFLRATTTALYIETFGAKATPVVWFLSVFALTVIISIYNKIQKYIGVQNLFSITSALSALIFIAALYLVNSGFSSMAYVLYIWKEIYIVMLVHMALGYANNFLTIDQAKIFFGPIGACGSIGGIIGGIVTAKLSDNWGIDVSIIVASAVLFVNALVFHLTRRLKIEIRDEHKKPSPIGALKGAGKYVMVIAIIIALSQFVINIANLQFNFLFEEIVPSVDKKASYLGTLFSLINGITLIVQLVVLPIVLSKFSSKVIHLFIPVFYFGLISLGLGVGAQFLWSVAGTFILLKGFDYSLFSMSKEILYYPLSPLQKYGAKYLADMLVYRLAKALMSLVLIYYQDLKLLTIAMLGFLVMWFVMVFQLFKLQKTIEK